VEEREKQEKMPALAIEDVNKYAVFRLCRDLDD
jgi:hypothetical protein